VGPGSPYQVFVEQSPIGIVHLDAEGRVIFENHALRAITGEEAEAAWIGIDIRQIGALDASIRASVDRLLTEGIPFQADEVNAASRTGSRLLSVRGAPIHGLDGVIIGGALMVQDVTEARRRDEALQRRMRFRKTEAALRRAAMQAADEQSFLPVAAEMIGHASRAARVHLLSYHDSDGRCRTAARWSSASVPPADDVTLALHRFPAARAMAETRNSEVVSRGSDDADKARLAKLTNSDAARWSPYYAGGDFQGFVVVEQRTHDEWELEESADEALLEELVRLFETLWSWIIIGKRYRMAIATIQDCLFSYGFTEDGRRDYRFITEQVLTLTGLHADAVQLSGAPLFDWVDHIVFDADRPEVRAHERRLRKGTSSVVTYRVQHADGTMRWVRETATPTVTPGGEISVTGLLSDISDQKEAELVLAKAKQNAEEASRTKSAFVATMSHELRTPLGTISGFASLLRREVEDAMQGQGSPLPPELLEFAESIHDRSRDLLALLDDLFDLSNIEAGLLALDIVEVELSALVRGIADRVRSSLDASAVELTTEIEDDVVAWCDSKRIGQAIGKVLDNAAKFTQEGRITLAVSHVGAEAIVEIRDTGVGIEKDYLERIFSPFVQEDSRLNRSYEGAGLGLTLVKRLVDLMGGRIAVESEKGRGTVVRLTLPTVRKGEMPDVGG
jgi:PAS domain S-box-containing protein